MKAQPNVRSAPHAMKRPVRLLLAGDENELSSDMMQRTFDAGRRVIITRAGSLLGALEHLQTEPADIVLLSPAFRDEEVTAFLSNAQRAGFGGLVLRVASRASDLGLARPSTAFRRSPLHFMHSMRRDGSSQLVRTFTERQRAVLVRVSEGWTNGQVARHLECTEAAIKATLQQIFKKLGVRKRSQVVRLALEQRLIDGAKAADHRRTNRVSPANLKAKDGYQVGDFVIDTMMHRVWVRGAETHLTPSEFELLEVFAAHQGELVRSSSLCEIFWRNPTSKQDSLRVLVRGLRAKIELSKVPQYIVTERSFGYRFHPSAGRSKSGRNLI
jgi:DNA-binding response OmpR family regulator